MTDEQSFPPPAFPPPAAEPAPFTQPSGFADPATPSVVVEVMPPPKPSRKGWWIGAGVAVVAVLLVGAFFLFSKDEGPTFSLEAAAQGAQDVPGVEFTFVVEVAGQTTTGNMRYDVDNRVMAMELSMPALGADSVQAIFDIENTTMYMETDAIPGMSDAVDTPWFSADLGENPQMAEAFGQMEGNPLDVAPLFENAKSVEDKGIERRNGEQQKHYVVTVDTADMLEKAPKTAEAITQMGGEMPETISYDVWISEDNQLRGYAFELTIAGITTTMSYDITKVGEIEPIVIPSADETTDMTDMMGG